MIPGMLLVRHTASSYRVIYPSNTPVQYMLGNVRTVALLHSLGLACSTSPQHKHDEQIHNYALAGGWSGILKTLTIYETICRFLQSQVKLEATDPCRPKPLEHS